MTPFAALLNRIASSPFTGANIVTDGQFTCAYREVPTLLDSIDGFLDERGIGMDAALGVECGNTLPGALLLVALLRRGATFAMFPPAVNAGELKPTPNFCRYRLIVSSSNARDAEPFSPLRYFQAELNPFYNGRPATPSKLYLRTSGSMGVSKIVVHDHERLLGNARNCAVKYGFNETSRAVIPVPIAHMYGFGAEFLPAIMTGAAIDLQEKTNLLKYLDREKHFQPTIVFATPAICEMLLKGYKTARTCYQVFVTSGQRIGDELFRAFDPWVSGRLINQYGSTELGATAACDPGDPLDLRAATIGKPMREVELRLETRDDPEAASAASELFCRHPYGFEGYLDEDGDWLLQVQPGAWYRTGDLARVQPDGSLTIAGRADASVNRRGYLVLLSDIERVMEKLDDLGEVAVVAGKDGSRQGQQIAAFCVPRPGATVDAAQLRRKCFDLLPQYAIPDEVHVTEQLPVLPSGKVDRKLLATRIG
jgi:acyl-CoA synthetase (AMP-forming)/AMP-acid ligase II